MYIEEITPDLVGQYISCRIYTEYIEKAQILYSEKTKEYYIAQNVKCGDRCKEYDYEEFRYTWTVEKGTPHNLSKTDVTNIQLLNYEKIYEVW